MRPAADGRCRSGRCSAWRCCSSARGGRRGARRRFTPTAASLAAYRRRNPPDRACPVTWYGFGDRKCRKTGVHMALTRGKCSPVGLVGGSDGTGRVGQLGADVPEAAGEVVVPRGLRRLAAASPDVVAAGLVGD